MVRLALTYQLILAVAVGPLLCCCTAGRLLASTPARPAGPSPAQRDTSPTPRVTHTCCAHKHKAAEPDKERGGDPKPAPSKPGEKCLCKDGGSQPTTAQAETVTGDVSALMRALELDLLVPFLGTDAFAGTALTVVAPDGSPGGNSAPLSTADLLYAHHNLRC